MQIKDVAMNDLRFFSEDHNGVLVPSSNAPSHLRLFLARQKPSVLPEMFLRAITYLATNVTPKPLPSVLLQQWAAKDGHAMQHINSVLGSKLSPKTYDELLERAHAQEFLRVVDLMREVYKEKYFSDKESK